jgi:hypothetical protein
LMRKSCAGSGVSSIYQTPLSKADRIWTDCYKATTEEYASPLLAKSLHGLPPARKSSFFGRRRLPVQIFLSLTSNVQSFR